MTRPTTTQKYASHLWGILDLLKADPTTPVVLRYPTRNQAKNMQLDFLAFKNAAAVEGFHKGKMIQGPSKFDLDELPESTYIPPEYPDLNAYRTKVRKEESGAWRLEMFHVDFTEEAKEVRRQLGMEEPLPRTQEVDELKAWLSTNDFDKPAAYANRPPKTD